MGASSFQLHASRHVLDVGAVNTVPATPVYVPLAFRLTPYRCATLILGLATSFQYFRQALED